MEPLSWLRMFTCSELFFTPYHQVKGCSFEWKLNVQTFNVILKCLNDAFDCESGVDVKARTTGELREVIVFQNLVYKNLPVYQVIFKKEIFISWFYLKFGTFQNSKAIDRKQHLRSLEN